MKTFGDLHARISTLNVFGYLISKTGIPHHTGSSDRGDSSSTFTLTRTKVLGHFLFLFPMFA